MISHVQVITSALAVIIIIYFNCPAGDIHVVLLGLHGRVVYYCYPGIIILRQQRHNSY